MPHYYQNEEPSRPTWIPTNNNMNASIVLDKPANFSFTNLDELSGKVVLRLPKSTDLTSIVVKLEGESRTRLLSAGVQSEGGGKQRPQLEYHKILYRVQLVFPPPDVGARMDLAYGKGARTLPPGTHEYPFTFKFPFNNSCSRDLPQGPKMSLSGSGIEVTKPAPSHVKKTLPPTMSGFPGEAEIRYFVKATISRLHFWKENPRAYANFNFFPIEPPRPPSTGSEIFARQRHTFIPLSDSQQAKAKLKGFFGKSKDPSVRSSVERDTPQISLDARLPEPAILTCSQPIPLRLVMKKLHNPGGTIFLGSLEISLVGRTRIRAQDVYRTEDTSWVIMSKSNIGVALGASSDPADTEIVIDDSLWRDQILPKTVAPSFVTCNIERSYQLDIRVGLSYAAPGQLSDTKTLSIFLPLRLDIQIFSGIAPPPELLEAMAEARASIRRGSTLSKPQQAHLSKLQTEGRTNFTAGTSMEPGSSSATAAQQGSKLPTVPAPEYSEAPPSYEDAVAAELPPVNGLRPDYQPPPPGVDDLLDRDEKRGLRGRRDS